MKKNNKNLSSYTEDELKQIQSIELSILKKVIRLCDENNINYFTVGGTTLGAIRHNGFIPWDDDIDIGMLREDYNKFLSIAKCNLDDTLFILNREENKAFPCFFTKICKKGTSFYERDTYKLKYEHSIFIDIFPFDNLPDDERIRERLKKKITTYDQLLKSRLLWKVSGVSTSKHKKIAGIARFLLHILLLPFSPNYLYRKMQKYSQKYNDKKTNLIASGGRTALEFNYCDVFPQTNRQFEDTIIKVPGNYDGVLTKQYGDYMTPPPPNKRVSHRPLFVSFGDSLLNK